ncbi:MAG: hypothetical protein ABFC95_06210 [Smithella sp.]
MLAGYPFGKNDLTLEEWEDLYKLREVMDAQKQPIPVYLVKIKQ